MYEGLKKRRHREFDDQIAVPIAREKKDALLQLASKHEAKVTDFIRYLVDRELEADKKKTG